jgi:hypothetical protein
MRLLKIQTRNLGRYTRDLNLALHQRRTFPPSGLLFTSDALVMPLSQIRAGGQESGTLSKAVHSMYIL